MNSIVFRLQKIIQIRSNARGTDNVLQNILHIQIEYGEYST